MRVRCYSNTLSIAVMSFRQHRRMLPPIPEAFVFQAQEVTQAFQSVPTIHVARGSTVASIEGCIERWCRQGPLIKKTAIICTAYIYIYILHVYTYTCLHTYIDTYLHTCTQRQTPTHVYVHTYVRICMSIRLFIYIYRYGYKHVYVYILVHICAYIHTYVGIYIRTYVYT